MAKAMAARNRAQPLLRTENAIVFPYFMYVTQQCKPVLSLGHCIWEGIGVKLRRSERSIRACGPQTSRTPCEVK